MHVYTHAQPCTSVHHAVHGWPCVVQVDVFSFGVILFEVGEGSRAGFSKAAGSAVMCCLSCAPVI